jgi:hypothetical protein
MKRLSTILLALSILVVPAILLAADTGNRDVFRVGKAEFSSATEFSVPLEVIHDEDLAAMDIPLTYSKGVTLNKITFEGTRVESFDEKIVNIDAANSRVIIGLIDMVYALKENPALKPAVNGDYKVAVLHFTLDDPTLKSIEIGTFNTEAPSHALMYVYNDWASGQPEVRELQPAFEGGLISLEARSGGAPIPTTYDLSQNVPNPFNPSTQVSFALPKAGQVTLSIYNVLGQQVTTLVDEYLPAGYQTVTWNGTDRTGHTVASGVYFYKIKAGEFSETKKMMMLK